MKHLYLLILLMFPPLVTWAQDIIPAPQSRNLNSNKSPLEFTDHLTILDPDTAFREEFEVIATYFLAAHNITLLYTTSKSKKPYILLKQINGAQAEGYELDINSKFATISGSKAGVFYGMHSLLQLAQVKGNKFVFASQQITDYPQYTWRGLHLDVCRHFFPASYVKKYIDLMARHKFNTFHWHLTEDQGWRIEITKYPKLTSVGAWRNGTMVGQYRNNSIDTVRYGGFYTQNEIREIVEYARKRHITIVPEIEMPGHALAAIASYPELSCTGKPAEVAKSWGVFNDVFCAGNDSVYVFLQNVLDEVCALFPGEYIHIGGDECPKENWKNCLKCQARIKSEGLKDEHQLQSFFIQRIEKYLNSKGRKIIGWDEILEGGLAPNAAVMSWRGTEGALNAANQGHPAVLTPGSHCYFDHFQGEATWEPVSIGGLTTVQKVYSFDPIPADLDSSKRHFILGGQANLWSEYILSEAQMDYMVYPRACAMAEALWLPQNKKKESDFLKRLTPHLLQLQKEGLTASWSHYRPQYTTNIVNHQPAIAVKPSTNDKIVLEYIPAPLSGFPIKKAVIKPDSLIEKCTALNTTYSWKFISLPGSGKVVFYSGPNYIQKDTLNLNFSLSSGAKISWITSPSSKTANPLTLVDGLTDDRPFYSERWVGFDTNSVQIEMDLGDENPLSLIKFSQLNEPHNNIYAATYLDVELSTDGINFKKVVPVKVIPTKKSISMQIMNVPARYLRLKVSAKGSPQKSRMVFDEISIN